MFVLRVVLCLHAVQWSTIRLKLCVASWKRPRMRRAPQHGPYDKKLSFSFFSGEVQHFITSITNSTACHLCIGICIRLQSESHVSNGFLWLKLHLVIIHDIYYYYMASALYFCITVSPMRTPYAEIRLQLSRATLPLRECWRFVVVIGFVDRWTLFVCYT